MNKLLIAGFSISAALLVAACDPTVETKKVQGAAVQACSFLPSADTVINIAKALYSPIIPFTDAASSIANKICDAVTSVPLADGPGDHKPRVAGVIVKGSFVK